MTDTLFIHMRAVRAVTMTQDNRARRSVADHRDIIAALEARDAEPRRAAGARTHHGPRGACRTARRFSRREARAAKQAEPTDRSAAERRSPIRLTHAFPGGTSVHVHDISGMPVNRLTTGAVRLSHGGSDVRRTGANRRCSRSRTDRRVPPGHRRAEAERRQNDLQRPGHSDHRSGPSGAGRGNAGDLVPARAERRQRGGDRGVPDEVAGRVPDGFGAGLSERAGGAGQRDDELLSDDPDQRLVRARDRRSAAGRLRGDGSARHRAAAVQGGVPRAARGRYRHRRRARDPRRGVRPAGRRVSRSAGQAVRPGDGGRGRPPLVGQGDRSGAGANPGAFRRGARAGRAARRQPAADHPRQGRGLCAGRRRHPRAGREERHSVHSDEHGQGPDPRPASAMRRRRALDRAAGQRRRADDRRAAQLAAQSRQRPAVGAAGFEEVHPHRHRTARDGQQRRDRRAAGGRHRLLRGGVAARHGRRLDSSRRPNGPGRSRTRRKPTSPGWRRGLARTPSRWTTTPRCACCAT